MGELSAEYRMQNTERKKRVRSLCIKLCTLKFCILHSAFCILRDRNQVGDADHGTGLGDASPQ